MPSAGLKIVLVIVENGVKLRLNIIDTPGYGDQINNDGCWDPIVKYVSAAGLSDNTWTTAPLCVNLGSPGLRSEIYSVTLTIR